MTRRDSREVGVAELTPARSAGGRRGDDVGLGKSFLQGLIEVSLGGGGPDPDSLPLTGRRWPLQKGARWRDRPHDAVFVEIRSDGAGQDANAVARSLMTW